VRTLKVKKQIKFVMGIFDRPIIEKKSFGHSQNKYVVISSFGLNTIDFQD
jgi:hypothetical protein